jgi:hypothetical protein
MPAFAGMTEFRTFYEIVNIERPTSNNVFCPSRASGSNDRVERSVYKKTELAYFAKWLRRPGANLLFEILLSLDHDFSVIRLF